MTLGLRQISSETDNSHTGAIPECGEAAMITMFMPAAVLSDHSPHLELSRASGQVPVIFGGKVVPIE
jgi:hypothetical protein